MKKVIVGGLLAGLALLVVGFVFGSLTADMYRLSPSGVFKAMDFKLLVAYDIVVGMLLAYVYSIIKNSVPGTGMQKGLYFGAIIFLVGTLPALGITYITMAIRKKLLLMWALQGLVAYLLAGAALESVEEKL